MTAYYPQTVIYEEKKTTYWIFMFILVFIGMMVFLVYLQTRASLGYFIILPLIGLSFGIFVTYNMAFYSVKIFDDKTIQFGFLNWNKKLQPSEINSIEEIPYHPIREFGGLGWRIGRGRKNGKWRIGYVIWLEKGIEIEAMNGKYYVFGTDNPQKILSLLQ
jgi:amino acid transporter|tara:strand:+ start:240 stop:722 length:483 start_codon:yes stop_codon:yes gene_type:complete